jgi:hypothetical protein
MQYILTYVNAQHVLINVIRPADYHLMVEYVRYGLVVY